MDPAMKPHFVIAIAGSSGSGKTTLATRLVDQCAPIGISAQILSLDSYYRPLDHLTLEERKAQNYDHPDSIDSGLAFAQLRDLCAGRAVRQPVYDFKVHTRLVETMDRAPTQLVVVEGLHALYFGNLLELCDYRIFVSTSIVTAVLRRIERDIRERGRTIEDVKRQVLDTVLPMFESYVKPTQKNAHFSIDWEGEEIPAKATEGLIAMVRDHFRRA
jgi:uridine kinase